MVVVNGFLSRREIWLSNMPVCGLAFGKHGKFQAQER